MNDGKPGKVIKRVKPGSAADNGGICPGDVNIYVYICMYR
jgi:hypothetical protein